tara:strand:- start:880 stop:1479 length:600 start_codon:yes stop_codon:yes gene_type:complete
MTLKLNGSSSGSVSIDAPASTTGGADVTLTLPVNDGDATQFLQTNGSGTLSFAGVNQGRGCFNAYVSAQQAFSHNTSAKLDCDTERFDADSWYDTSNQRYTPQIAGYYHINGIVRYQSGSNNSEGMVSVRKNGTSVINSAVGTNGYAGTIGVTLSCLIQMNGSDDYLELWGYQYDSGSGNKNAYADTNSEFSGYLVYPT